MSQIADWRLFVAITIPDELRRGIVAIQDGLRRSRADVKWVESENLHLTLKFLGEVPAGRVGAVVEALRGMPARPPFPMTLQGTGAFPGTGSPRVIWIGLTQGKAEFTALASDVDGALKRIGYPEARKPVSPHLTLGRVRGPTNGEALRAAIERSASVRAGGFTVAAVHLYRSELRPSGPIYTAVAGFPFRGRSSPS